MTTSNTIDADTKGLGLMCLRRIMLEKTMVRLLLAAALLASAVPAQANTINVFNRVIAVL